MWRCYLQEKRELPGLGSQPYNSILKQKRSFGEDEGRIRIALVINGSLNLYSTRDEASMFPGITLKKHKYEAKVLQVQRKNERKKEIENKQINEETKMC